MTETNRIEYKETLKKRQWYPVALREAVINAFVHNDYSREIAPKFELFDDRLEITTYGGLPQGLSKEEFFQGVSIPRSKELMRIYRDMDLVEQLGSGVPRILQSYGKECFKFSDNFIRMSFPVKETTENVTEYVTENVTEKRRLQVVEFMHKNPSITTEQLSKMLKVSKRTIIRDIEKLKNNNQIEYIGPAKGGHWKIIKK